MLLSMLVHTMFYSNHSMNGVKASRTRPENVTHQKIQGAFVFTVLFSASC